MKTPAKIQLSSLEMELITNTNWILTKNNIIKKVIDLLGAVQAEQQDFFTTDSSSLPKEVIQTSAKISKGENYQGLPYLILDQPRFFNKENVFAIRHLFWWGNFFSSTFHLSGKYKETYQKKIIQAFSSLSEDDFFVCIHPDQWHHHFEEDNFVPINKLTAEQFEEIILGNTFIKLSKKVSLKEWDKVQEKLTGTSRQYLSILAT
ncbi:MAG: hypothetical protein WDN26_22025 [Chitinophagaceae bacterium]